MHPWLLQHLVCPRDRGSLVHTPDLVVCEQGHRYTIVHDIPVMLVNESTPTHESIQRTLAEIGAGEKYAWMTPHTGVDPVVQEEIAATNGLLYRPLIGRMARYPIPPMRLPPGHGGVLLDIGCNWGRWTVAAARNGYRPIGLDPNLRALVAAQRVCAQLGVEAVFVAGDARQLPFADASVDAVFSYSVLQHFSKKNVRASLEQVRRVTEAGGTSFIQMPNALGVRSLYHMARRGKRPLQGFEVRYWTPSEMRRTFESLIGPTTLSVDGYFGLGIQAADIDLLPQRFRLIVRLSELLRHHAEKFPWMVNLADSLYVQSRVLAPRDKTSRHRFAAEK